MSLKAALLPEFDYEMSLTRRQLESVPDGDFEWQPHPKSMKIGMLASHLAELPSWTTSALAAPELDIMPAGGPAYSVPTHASRAAILASFDANVATAHTALAAATDAQLLEPWTLKRTGEVIFTMPKASVVRGMVINHMIHHRAQLGVYLRLQDVPLPSIYGPTADNAAF